MLFLLINNVLYAPRGVPRGACGLETGFAEGIVVTVCGLMRTIRRGWCVSIVTNGMWRPTAVVHLHQPAGNKIVEIQLGETKGLGAAVE